MAKTRGKAHRPHAAPTEPSSILDLCARNDKSPSCNSPTMMSVSFLTAVCLGSLAHPLRGTTIPAAGGAPPTTTTTATILCRGDDDALTAAAAVGHFGCCCRCRRRRLRLRLRLRPAALPWDLLVAPWEETSLMHYRLRRRFPPYVLPLLPYPFFVPPREEQSFT